MERQLLTSHRPRSSPQLRMMTTMSSRRRVYWRHHSTRLSRMACSSMHCYVSSAVDHGLQHSLTANRPPTRATRTLRKPHEKPEFRRTTSRPRSRPSGRRHRTGTSTSTTDCSERRHGTAAIVFSGRRNRTTYQEHCPHRGCSPAPHALQTLDSSLLQKNPQLPPFQISEHRPGTFPGVIFFVEGRSDWVGQLDRRFAHFVLRKEEDHMAWTISQSTVVWATTCFLRLGGV
jgi:hypothetical protein